MKEEEMVRVTIEATAQLGGWSSDYETRANKVVSIECPLGTMKQISFEQLCANLAQIAVAQYEKNAIAKESHND